MIINSLVDKQIDKIRILLYADGVEEGFKTGHLKFFNTIIKSLKKKNMIEEIWVGSVGGKITNEYEEENSEYNVFGFKDAVDLLEKLSPDLILLTNTQEHIQRSTLIAAKFKKIPSVVIKAETEGIFSNENNVVFKRISMLFLKPSPSWPILGILILKKYYFIFKTLKKIGKKLFPILSYLIKDMIKLSKSFSIELQNDDADLYLVSNQDWLNYSKKLGINQNKIKIIGSVTFDEEFDKILKLNKVINLQFEILFLTSPLAEHGIWSFSQRDNAVIKIISSIKNNIGDHNLKIKIHPTSETLEHYKKIINPISSEIKLYQKGDVTKLINEADIVIALGDSTALYTVALLKKPLILMNLFNNDWFFGKQKFVNNCKSIEEMAKHLKNKDYFKNEKDYNIFIDKFIPKFDGKCSEKAANYIFELLKNKDRL